MLQLLASAACCDRPAVQQALVMADTAKSSAGLHVNAAPFVPGSASKGDLKASNAAAPAAATPAKATPAPAAATANGTPGAKQSPAGNGMPAQTPEKAADEKPSPGPNSKGPGGGGKGSKGGAKQGASTPGSSSKLAAAASAAPFVPSTTRPGMHPHKHDHDTIVNIPCLL